MDKQNKLLKILGLAKGGNNWWKWNHRRFSIIGGSLHVPGLHPWLSGVRLFESPSCMSMQTWIQDWRKCHGLSSKQTTKCWIWIDRGFEV